ncbi:hypothetical protein [Curtobacterium flaccumfaciens]|uniref:hypothetical protein n=1 Tax=Curtobacterium flaccumfaciens TaxID=2035 RepID=UPI00112EF496|nr:hypothetical protein [Curtobacterium flaccumfaciens]TPG07045.1 hypothetical protein EAH85_09970 [Curtobacterium flaccumfaciens]
MGFVRRVWVTMDRLEERVLRSLWLRGAADGCTSARRWVLVEAVLFSQDPFGGLFCRIGPAFGALSNWRGPDSAGQCLSNHAGFVVVVVCP